MKRHATNGALRAVTVRNKLLHHIETAIKDIRPRNPSDAQIHNARKELKRARANLRLLRDTVGKAVYTSENAALRDAARRLSGVRDAAVLGKTTDKLIRAARRGPRRRLLVNVRRILEQERLKARTELWGTDSRRASVACLVAAARRIRQWPLERVDRATVCDGLQRIYRQGRKALAISCAKPTAENLHEWRKQVKYLSNSMEMWKTQERNNVRRLIRQAEKLADLLGTDHDLVVFEERLEKLDSPNPIQTSIARDIAHRRCDLQKKAMKKGRLLFKSKPRTFVRSIAQPRDGRRGQAGLSRI